MIWRVSSSGRTCGRPRQRLPSEAALAVSWAACWQAGDCWWGVILAMPLHDACHSIDSLNIGDILENIKFPNLGPKFRSAKPARPPGATVMTHQPIAFELERAVPADDALKDLLAAPPEATIGDVPVPVARRKFNFRKMLMTGAAVAALAGAVWYGWDYWTVGQYLVSTDDAYVKADNTTIAPKVSGYLREVLVGDNERVSAGQVLARIDERDFQVA